MRDVVLYIAVSLDGYIADPNGGVSWLDSTEKGPNDEKGYEQFIETVDTVVMGYNTYHQIVTELSPDKWPYPQLESYVFTHRKLVDAENIHFVSQAVDQWIRSLQTQPGKYIWICGGAHLAKQCMDADLIDRYHLTVIPSILGSGIPLFPAGTRPARLKLLSLKPYNGAMECILSRSN